MKTILRKFPALLAGCALTFFAAAALAQDAPPAQIAPQEGAAAQNPGAPQADPSGRVARLNFMQGPVSFLPAGGGQDDWVTATTNRPVTIGDKIWVDQGGHAELHIGSTAIRMDQSTGISILNLNDNTTQLQFTDGSIELHIERLAPNETYEVDTPNIAFTTQTAGVYRIDTNTDGNKSVVTVRDGQGEVTGGGRSYNVQGDQQAVFSGTDTLDYDLLDADAQPANDFDNWCADRDKGAADPSLYAHLSPDMTGVEDLAANGTWTDTPDYGYVWAPTTVAVGWAPYRFGHWVYIAPWGWTWVGDEPWGFAPFHYGRWAFYGARWVWVPGPIGPRPYYAPALVAWVGGGPGFGFSFGVGIGAGVGWFPLGPREVFVPWYHVSTVYVTRVNVTNTFVDRTTIVNTFNGANRNVTYANQHVAGGITAVSHDAFVRGESVSRNSVEVSREAMSAPVMRQAPATPQAASFRGGAEAAPVRPPEAIMNRTVVAKQMPPGPNSPNGFLRAPNISTDRPPASRNVGNPNGNVTNSPRGQTPANPQVKPAPPVHAPTPQEKAKEDAKQKSWHDAHPRPPKKDGKSK